jgi:hypothetical protein
MIVFTCQLSALRWIIPVEFGFFGRSRCTGERFQANPERLSVINEPVAA